MLIKNRKNQLELMKEKINNAFKKSFQVADSSGLLLQG